jgi:alpha-tubulin suppressor-like RCC1 family protein
MQRIAALWVAIVFAGCGAADEPVTGQGWIVPARIVLSEATVDFTAIGATKRLTATALAADGTPIRHAPIEWSSTDPAVASVDSAGVVTALSQGRAEIVASHGGVAAKAHVRVSPIPKDLAQLSIVPQEPTLTFIGQSLELRALALDIEGRVLSEVLAAWQVDDESVATVDRLGVVEAVGPGTTRVRATILDGTLSTEATLTVRPLPSTLIFLSQPVDAMAGEPQPHAIRVEARDAGGHVVSTEGLVVALEAAYEDRTLPLASSPLAEGIATFERLVLERAAERIRLVARHESTEATSDAFRVVHGPPRMLGFLDPPRRVEARIPFDLRVAVTDEFGNPVPSESAEIHLSLASAVPADLSLTGELRKETVDGIATFAGLRVDRASEVTLEADSVSWPGAEARILSRYAFVSLSAGGDHACGLLRSGEVLCFGSNDSGQLGLPSDVTHSPSPTPVTTLPFLRSVEAGAKYTCGVSLDDETLCWGAVPGRTQPSAAPVSLALPGGSPVRSLGLGQDHLCVVAEDGSAHCLGNNADGQLGDGTTTARDRLGPVDAITNFASIAAGDGFTCAIDVDGVPWCWGRNDRMQLGGVSEQAFEPTPLPLEAHRLLSVSLGSAHACGLATDGRVLCWGDASFGRLGDGQLLDASAPQFAELEGRCRQVVVGDSHGCALRDDGRLFCWGKGEKGRLGTPGYDDEEAFSAFPVPVRPPFEGARFVHVTAGAAHGCAIEETGPSYCWGEGEDGRLGDGEAVARSVPTPVDGTAE